ncbi:Uma2 family endonuclease [Aphanizomenon flos-aquae NRERC-008]|uniref:Uma2 family endonuclease n=1 Tax=Aphanizomenon flos-aquae FACHB-1249 TaxID=2692889 RepID=A0ABR8ISH2_APHFL|nr:MULTISPECIES: Uma2 family endonuclease [Aphanizomenon]MBD2389741.1 Uma2 family endonuclease [Aphanizomenon flos-aquae FACHB-1171]MBD2556930.1 Uma2 family endonuclease [Aphanizomenon flos-aquae FACHB-1290]MBD2631280.1 Uma2 family endonuclease [Aphanizomenon sp. FACHB-1399]MBD2643897.1 Uma2 family endonuclease [Aphanizomenon sp. FACHB-1401]MBD2655974.1 Uma2 family endonuclease [Aphanizomenon flos-aquae FACHB-1265]
MNALTVSLKSVIDMTDDQFFQLCQNNRELRFERNANGELIIMSPAGGETGNRNGRLNQQLFNWTDADGTGIAFDSSTGFKLPNGADRSPDASWIKLERWDALTDEEKRKFPPICPDFVIELLSPSDSLKTTQEKMKEYIDNGVRLGILINRKSRQVEIYRPGKEVEVLDSPATVLGEDVLKGFVLNLAMIW